MLLVSHCYIYFPLVFTEAVFIFYLFFYTKLYRYFLLILGPLLCFSFAFAVLYYVTFYFSVFLSLFSNTLFILSLATIFLPPHFSTIRPHILFFLFAVIFFFLSFVLSPQQYFPPFFSSVSVQLLCCLCLKFVCLFAYLCFMFGCMLFFRFLFGLFFSFH